MADFLRKPTQLVPWLRLYFQGQSGSILRMTEARRILITSGLPYANGHIHMGHLVEYLQTDIWARFQRMQDHQVLYVCGDDTHGTAIMLRAREEKRSETEVITEMALAHRRDFDSFGILFDHYSSTNSDANRKLCEEMWSKLHDVGLIVERSVEQLYDPKEGLFLADRFVSGTCPRCDSSGQHGDACDSCGATYSTTELKNPVSTISGATPITRSSQHQFINIEKNHEFLNEWVSADDHLQPSVANYLKGHFLSAPLQDWDVSRPAPYFGFEIPGQPDNYWYVWFDAPIGYMAATQEWCDKTGNNFDDYWRSPKTEIVHVIGKDITYFHALFWPAMLHAAGFTLPKKIHVHGFLTVNGEKMSKSKGTHIRAETFAKYLNPQQLRYYYASRLGSKADDLDLDLEDFTTRVNSDLIGKVVNLASRSARFIQEVGLSSTYPEDGGLFADGASASAEITEAYEAFEFSRAMRRIMKLADQANEYIDRVKPWTLAKAEGKATELQAACSIALNLYRQIVIYLAPVLPQLAERSAELFGTSFSRFQLAQQPVVGIHLQPFKHLMARVDPRNVKAVLAASVEKGAPATPDSASAGKKPKAPEASPSPGTADGDGKIEPIAEQCTFDDFCKVDLRVAKIVNAEEVKGSKKLLLLTVNLGDHDKTIFAGIRAAYTPGDLLGKLVVVVANLAPRKMKCGTSEGMAIAAGPGGRDIFLLSPDSGASPGQRIS